MTLWILWSIATSALVAAAAVALDRAASYVGSSRRHVWIGAIVMTVTAPVLLGLRRVPAGSTSAVGPITRVDLTALASPHATLSIQELANRARRVVPAPSTEPPRSHRASTGAEWPNTFATWSIAAERADAWVVRAWIFASSILLTLFTATVLRLNVTRSRWKTVETEVGCVLLAPNIGPAVVGFLQPHIVLPSWALSVEARMRELLLRHELEHLRTGDTRTLLVTELSLVVFPWNAPLWWMVRRLRVAIEMDCDARVIRATGNVYEYALMLLIVGERHSAGLRLAASLAEPRSSLEARIDAMTADRRRRPIAACVPLLAVAVITLVTAAWAPRPHPLLTNRVTNTSAGTHHTETAVAQPHRPLSRADTAVSSISRRPGTPETVVARPAALASTDPKPLPPFPPPMYPEQLRVAHVEGHVLLRLRTDARGLPDTVSIEIIESTNDLFTVAVRNALRAWRFDSAGEVRLAFRFMSANGSGDARAGLRPAFTIDGKPVEPVVITVPDSRPGYWLNGVRVSDTVPNDSSLSAVGYLQRKQSGMGFFMDGAAIDRRAPSFSQALRDVPGLRISPIGDGRTYFVQDARNPTDGCVNMFVDGTLWRPATPGDIDQDIRPANLVAIEAYHVSQAPSQFTPNDRPGCATIVVWTQSRIGKPGAAGPARDDTLNARTVTGDSIPVTAAQAEAEGAVFPRADAPPDIQPFFQDPFAGTTARRCVVASEADDPRASGSLRSGEMIVRGSWNDPRGFQAGEKNKLLWAPLHGSAL